MVKNIPAPLRHALARGTLTPIVGPDLGTIGVPDSQDLATALARYAGREDLEGTPLLEVLEEALLDLGDQAVVQFLRDQMQPSGTPGTGTPGTGTPGTGTPGSLHHLLARLPCTLYGTTAWDGLLEQALTAAGRHAYRVVEDNDLAYQPAEATLLLALWGTLDRPDSLRLTSDERDRLPHAAPGMVALLRQRARAGGLLLLGYGAKDPALAQVLALVRESLAQAGARAYALLPDADPRTLRRLEHQGVMGITAPPGDILEPLLAAADEPGAAPMPSLPAPPTGTATAEATLSALRQQRLLEDIAALEEILAQHQRNLRTLELRIAQYGLDVPLHLLSAREKARRQLEVTQQELRDREQKLADL